MKKQVKPVDKPGGIPSFRYGNHTYQLLNQGLEVEVDGVAYHLSSEFAGEGEMGTVLDLIELERNKRNTA